MQAAIKAGDTGQIQQLLSKRFPGLSFQPATEEDQVDKPQETAPAVAPMRAGVQRRSTATGGLSGGELIGDIYNDYIINLPSAVRPLVTTDVKGTRGGRLGEGGYTTESIIPGAQVPEPEAPKAAEPFSGMSAQDIFKNYSQYDQGQQGLFGGQDVDYLRAQGVGDETIREVARLSSETQQTPAAVYARLGGTLTSAQSTSAGPDPQQYAKNYLSGTSDVGAQGIFGGQDVDAMRAKGYTDEQIRATAKAIRGSGQELPPAVFRRLGEF